MAPKIYSIRASPPVRAVFMCAKALGAEVEEVFVDLLAGDHLKEDFLKKNPQHTVPVLEDDDGFIVSDSHAIMAYLVAKYGKDDTLYPKNDYKQRAIIDHKLYFDASILFARGLVMSKNPQHTVPVLEDDDGFVVADSHAIMAYLVAKYGKDDSLYPKNDYKQRAIIDHRLHFDSGILFARGLVCSKPLIYQDLQPTKEKLAEIKDAYQILDKILTDNKSDYVAGNKLTIADFSIVSTVTSWIVFVPYSDFPNIKRYVERAQKQPWYKENIAGLEEYKLLIKSKLKV